MYKVIWYKVIIILFVIIFLTRGETCKIFNSTFADQDEIQRDVKKDNTHAYNFNNLKICETLKDDNLTKIYDLSKEDDDFKKKQKYFIYSYYDYLNSSIYDGDSYVIYVDLQDDFDAIFLNSDSSWFVNFYSHSRIDCETCPFFAPVWKEVAKLLDGVVKFAAINCKPSNAYWEICLPLEIRAYPTLLYFKKDHSRPEVPWIHVNYTGKRTQEAIINFVLNELNINVPRIYQSLWKMSLSGSNFLKKPMLILICDDSLNCLTSNERLIVAATFNKLIDVSWFLCKSGNCHNKMSRNTYAVYLPTFTDASSWKPVFVDSMSNIHTLIEKLLDQLPNPQQLSDNHFQHIRKTKSNDAWLIYFYIIDKRYLRDMTLTLKKFLIETRGFNISKINCVENLQLCCKLGVYRYPMWGMLKQGGAFELHYGNNTYNDTLKFALSSVKMTNVWTLSTEEVSAILRRNNENEVWLLNWFLPWSPPSIQFLSDFRKASLEFDASTIRFGTVDCEVHATLCIPQRFPTMTLINGNNTAYSKITPQEIDVFTIIQFINENRNSSVIKITRKNFRELRKKNNKVIWIVNYFASCEPCKKLVPHWITVATSLSALSFVNVATINCETDFSLCESEGIFSFPEIRLYPLESVGLSRPVLYNKNGQQNWLHILEWITTFFPKKVLDFNTFNFQELMLDDENIRVVFFYFSHCWYSRTIGSKFAIAAQLLKEVKFGKVCCDVDDNHLYVCSNIKIYPIIMLYEKKRQNKDDGIEIVANTAEAIRDEILKIIKTHDGVNSRTKHDEL